MNNLYMCVYTLPTRSVNDSQDIRQPVTFVLKQRHRSEDPFRRLSVLCY